MRLLGSGTEVVVVEDSNPRTVNDVFQAYLYQRPRVGLALPMLQYTRRIQL